jgi:hypothetical protein
MASIRRSFGGWVSRCAKTDASVSKTPLPGNYSDTDLLSLSPPLERPGNEATGASLARVSGWFNDLLTFVVRQSICHSSEQVCGQQKRWCVICLPYFFPHDQI